MKTGGSKFIKERPAQVTQAQVTSVFWLIRHLPADQIPGTSQRFCTFISSHVFKGTSPTALLLSSHLSGAWFMSYWFLGSKVGGLTGVLGLGRKLGLGDQRLSQGTGVLQPQS